VSRTTGPGYRCGLIAKTGLALNRPNPSH
jgi:hypothetical protein